MGWVSQRLIHSLIALQSGGAGDRRSSGSLFGRLGSLKKTKKSPLVESKCFLVHYLGCQAVSKVDGLETVRPVVGVRLCVCL